MIHSPMGLSNLKPANCLKVAMEIKKETPKMTTQEIRRNYIWTHERGVLENNIFN